MMRNLIVRSGLVKNACRRRWFSSDAEKTTLLVKEFYPMKQFVHHQSLFSTSQFVHHHSLFMRPLVHKSKMSTKIMGEEKMSTKIMGEEKSVESLVIAVLFKNLVRCGFAGPTATYVEDVYAKVVFHLTGSKLPTKTYGSVDGSIMLAKLFGPVIYSCIKSLVFWLVPLAAGYFLGSSSDDLEEVLEEVLEKTHEDVNMVMKYFEYEMDEVKNEIDEMKTQFGMKFEVIEKELMARGEDFQVMKGYLVSAWILLQIFK